jgi:hypothetical protein
MSAYLPGDDTPAEDRRRAAIDRTEPARRAPPQIERVRRGRAIVAAIMTLTGGFPGGDPLEYVETERPKRYRGGRR